MGGGSQGYRDHHRGRLGGFRLSQVELISA